MVARRHYYGIDLLRGLAAVSILIWHYQHFIALGMAPPGSRSGYPLYGALWLFYEQGGAAVQLFWIISGFVFSAVYSGERVTGRAFLAHRVARLYPLHLVTLLVVAALQMACRAEFGHDLIYEGNTLGAFALQLFMASGWPPQAQLTFNGPVWSVSAEVLIYLVFWLALPVLFRWRVAVPLLLAAMLFPIGRYSSVLLCGAYFFVGCAIYAFHSSASAKVQIVASIGGFAAFAAILTAGFQGIAVLFLFSGLVLAVAALERTKASEWAKRVPWLADNTYGTYLWHIPVQLVLLLLLGWLGISRAIAFSPAFLIAYLAIVMCVARASFLLIEKPARRVVRRLDTPPARKPPPSVSDILAV